MKSADRALIKLPTNVAIQRELRLFLKTAKYIERKADLFAPPTTKKILYERAEDNRKRLGTLTELIKADFVAGQFFAAGQARTTKEKSAQSIFGELLTYLIENTFPKLGDQKVLKDSDDLRLSEINAVLRANDVGQQSELSAANADSQAYDEVRNYIKLATSSSNAILLKDLIERYEKRPYGWPDYETALVIARLFIVGEISLIHQGGAVDTVAAVELLT